MTYLKFSTSNQYAYLKCAMMYVSFLAAALRARLHLWSDCYPQQSPQNTKLDKLCRKSGKNIQLVYANNEMNEFSRLLAWCTERHESYLVIGNKPWYIALFASVNHFLLSLLKVTRKVVCPRRRSYQRFMFPHRFALVLFRYKHNLSELCAALESVAASR